jgi:DNA-binding protein H-NS
VTQLAELLQRQAALDSEIRELQRAVRLRAIDDIRALMAEHGLTVADLIANRVSSTKSHLGRTAKTVAAKYRDPASGATWSGRGLTPKWLVAKLAEGKAKEDFALR